MNSRVHNARYDALRNALQSSSLARFVGVYDALTSTLVERAGFEGLWASSLQISMSLGLEDNGVITMTELADVTSVIVRATSLPVVIDAESGFGGCQNVARSVQEFARCGCAGISIQDTLCPTPNSFSDNAPALLDIDAAQNRYSTAVRAARDCGVLILARCEGLTAGLSPALTAERCQQFAKAGVDGIIVHSKSSTASELSQFMALWNKCTPIVCIPTAYPTVTESHLRQLGVGATIYANVVVRSLLKTLPPILAKLHAASSLSEVEDEIAPFLTAFTFLGGDTS